MRRIRAGAPWIDPLRAPAFITHPINGVGGPHAADAVSQRWIQEGMRKIRAGALWGDPAGDFSSSGHMNNIFLNLFSCTCLPGCFCSSSAYYDLFTLHERKYSLLSIPFTLQELKYNLLYGRIDLLF